MATKKEKEELMEILKFTPRTYKLRLWGYGGEYVMGTVDRKIYDYFRERRLDVEEFSYNYEYALENNIPEEMFPFEPGSWHDCDNLGHSWGVDRFSGTIQVDDENGDTVYEKQLESISGYDEDNPEPSWAYGDEVWIDGQPKGTVVFIGTSGEKGTFFEADIELKMPFDPSKICLSYDEIDGNEIITSVSYDGEELENVGGDTNGKSAEYGFYIAGSSGSGKKFERYKDLDDIEYQLSDWYSSKTPPERLGKYNIKTKDGHSYQAMWNGEYWHSVWNEEKITVKEWQGIAYDPDTHVFNDNEEA